METIWGFDLGVASVGFAVIRRDPHTFDGEVVRLGVRVFPESREQDAKGPGDPRNAARRGARLMRRQTHRKRWRRVHLRALLTQAGLIEAEQARPPHGQDPMALRARGLDAALSRHELGWALFHLLKRRGFAGSRKHGEVAEKKTAQAEKEAKEAKETESKLASFKAEIGNAVLSRHLLAIAEPERRRGKGIARPMVEDELGRLWEAQRLHHPDVLTDEFRAKLDAVALAQRPTFFRRRSVGRCELVPEQERALKGEWLGQQAELLQLVNALRLEGGNMPPLDADQRSRAIAFLSVRRDATWAQLRTAIGVGRAGAFSHERGKAKGCKGNGTEAAIIAALGAEAWAGLPDATRQAVRDGLAARLHAIEYRERADRYEIRIAAEIAEARAAQGVAMARDWGLSDEQGKALAQAEIPQGWSRHSTAALARLMPHLESGAPYATAKEAAFPEHRESSTPLKKWPEPQAHANADRQVAAAVEQALAGIRNPTVLRTLSELQKVANTLLRAHGRPDRIQLEFARDLKNSAQDRRETLARNRELEKRRDAAREKIRACGKDDSPANVRRVLLMEEQGGICPYTNSTVSLSQALDGSATDIDHIFPRSRSFDDSFGNQVLCLRGANRDKGNRTPQEWLAGDAARLEDLKAAWARIAKNNREWETKQRRMLRAVALEAPGSEAFTQRQLRDTAYAAVAARAYLGLLWGGGQEGVNRVGTVSGRATSMLRRKWGLGLRSLLDRSEEERDKLREDHRHHAVDALAVALTTPRDVAALSRWWQLEETGVPSPGFAQPWPALRMQAKAWLEQLVVSHKVQAKLTGALHEDTRLGDTGEGEDGYSLYVKRKAVAALTAPEICGDKASRIRDAGVERAIETAFAQAGVALRDSAGKPAKITAKDMKRVLGGEIRLRRTDSTPGPIIRRVRLLVRRDPSAMLRTHATRNIYAELGAGSLHHLAIYIDGMTARFLVVTRREAQRLTQTGGSAVLPRHPDGGRLAFSVCARDVLCRKVNGQDELVIVRKVNANGRIFYKPLTMATEPKPEVSFNANCVLDGWRKVAVDPIGRVRPAR